MIGRGPRAFLFGRLGAPGELRAAELFVSALILILGVVALHAACLAVYPKPELDPYGISDFYPLSVFRLRRPLAYQLALALASFGVFAWLWPRLSAPRTGLGAAFAATLGLAVASNLLLGFRYGIDYPTATAGAGAEYYDDAVLLQGALWLLARFNDIQPYLLEHTRTHPPGPVLLYYVLWRALGSPAWISLAVGALSLALGLPFLRRLLRLVFPEEPPGALVLYGVLPGSLIYGIAVVDAFIASLFLATLAEFLDERRRGSSIGAALFLAASLFFTFGALFLLPVLVGFELVRRRRLTRSALTIGLAALLLAVLAPLFGFHWLESLLTASAIENARGWLPFAEPRRYLWYRLGAVAEILIFFTPFLTLLLVRGRGALWRVSPDGYALAWLGPATLAAMLLAGALKIGEAARICLFILPYLLLPALAAFRELDPASRRRTACAVLAWGLGMQLFGFYLW